MTEKVDGTNIRITSNLAFLLTDPPKIEGRTDKALIQPNLFRYLQEKFTVELIANALGTENQPPGYDSYVTIYGEGYGSNIQAAGPSYREDPSFILFDIKIDRHWLSRESVKDIASKLGVPTVPDLGIMTEEEIVAYVKSKPMSLCSEKPQVMEGIVARSKPVVYDRHGNPFMFKLKCKEFV